MKSGGASSVCTCFASDFLVSVGVDGPQSGFGSVWGVGLAGR
jgi:hypothetical protein